MELLAAEAARAMAGRLAVHDRDRRLTSYHTDSRTVVPGGVFFALRGAAMDGHAFCAEAAARGAAAVVVDREEVHAPDAAVIQVGDTWRALYDLAAHVLGLVSPVVVGVTGSNGKTSTKELAAAVLGVRHRVLRTEGNLNSETGLPLTLLRLEREHTAAVLEMGMQGPGEIARLAALARPRVGIVTMVGTVHLEFFPSRDALALAKAELVEALPADGLAVLNAEDDYFDLLRQHTAAPVVSFGLEAGDLRATGYRALPDGGAEVTVEGVRVRLGLGGRHQARNALAALAAGRFTGVPIAAGAAALAGVGVDQRLEALAAPGGYTVVDDAYNASPESMLAAFEAVAERPRSGRLLALLGEMRELGAVAESAHEAVGRRAAEVFDRVAVIDEGLGGLLAEAAGGQLVADREAAINWVRAIAGPGDVVLVKASHGIGLHEVVRKLAAIGKPVMSDIGRSGGAS
ncbi:MAG TPA: UDP-N-acetylmuramoyl-tripeptide--D-alanyl-D-alanine ligase [Candidatus Dormibacteraeota bacterium]|nr:UDP-N-acetylmuramoyl-tripeptide--D-alanyl-D-alanine ligase [Candidatus Dormibacteraeota bacterium]